MKQFTSVQKICSLVLKAAVTVCALVGTYYSTFAMEQVFMGGMRGFMYFTILP